MKYCTKCGNLLNDDDLFCPKCGTKQLVAELPKEEVDEKIVMAEPINDKIVEQKPVIEETIIENPMEEEEYVIPEKEEIEEVIEPDEPEINLVNEEIEEINEPEEKEIIITPKNSEEENYEIIEEELEELELDEEKLKEAKGNLEVSKVEKPKENDEVELLKAKIEALEKQVNEKTEVKEEPIVEKEAKPVAKNQNTNDLKATESVIMIVGYTIIFFIYCILNATVLNEGAFIGKLGLLFATGVFFAMFIVKMVKAKNRKLQFLFFMNLTFAIIMGMYIIGNLIILSQS